MNAIDYFFAESKFSNNLFIVNKNQQVSHKQLYTNVNNLANFLKAKLKLQSKVLLISNNSNFFITVYLAVIKSGNICIPINAATKTGTIKFIIDETKPDICFIQNKLKRLFKELTIVMHSEDELEEVLKQNYKSLNNQSFDSNLIAELIYTSGSTAKPKGVMLSHKNLIANTASIIEYLKLNSSDKMLVVLPFYYCYGLSLLHTHLKAGAAIVLNNTFMLIGSVINDLKKYECTGFAGVPSHFQILLRKSDSFKNTEFPHLKYVTQAGGKLHNAFIEEFIKNFPNIIFFVMYGQTEATARLSYLPQERLKEKMGSIGIPIPHVKLKLINEKGKTPNQGEIGEIIAKGDNIMAGYFNEPKLTAQSIINGYLHTGDLAYQDEDGYFFLTARKKEIIKVGGERISPKEIEEIIVSFKGVIDCTIEAIEDEILGEKLKATVITNKPDNDFETQLIQYCKKHLSSIKIPQIINLEHEMKLSSSGKKIKS